jgi:cell pole-organizing protein PopZ
MSAAEAQAEPTMEEILASIRRIISEGDEPAGEAADAPAGAAAAAAAAAVPDDDVLELSEAMMEAAPAASDAPLDQSSIDDLMIFDRAPEPEPEMAPEPEPMEMFEQAPAPIAETAFRAPEPISAYQPVEGLVSAEATSAALGALSKLHMAIPVYTGPEATLETVVKDLLRPMLKQWLEDNLPAIVEAKVEAEVARIARTLR